MVLKLCSRTLRAAALSCTELQEGDTGSLLQQMHLYSQYLQLSSMISAGREVLLLNNTRIWIFDAFKMDTHFNLVKTLSQHLPLK